MSAELVDPFATPPREQLKTADMCEDIAARLMTFQRDDPPLYPQLVQKVLAELKRAEIASADPYLRSWARWLLEQLHHRSVSGIPYDEPQEPAWSLDSSDREPLDSYREPPLIRRVETVVDDL